MRAILPEKLEDGRVTRGLFATPRSYGPYGKFIVQGPCGAELMIVASGADIPEAQGWEHVSVSIPNAKRCPNWPEMCFVKDLFWSEDEAVVQFHPPKSEYVNNHPFCLHLWRAVDQHMRLPPSIMVGIKDRGEMSNDERLLLASDIFRAGSA
jgi:hypothetical protein